MTKRQKRNMGGVVLVVAVGILVLSCFAYADNVPSAARGHMGCLNTAAVGMVPVGDGTGFCEQALPENCALAWDGAAVECSDGTGGTTHFSVTYSGLPPEDQIVYFPVLTALSCPDDFAGSVAKAKTASTGTVAFTIKKNGSTVGTATFTASATGVFATSGGATTFVDGDTFEVVAPPATQDATLSDVGLTFECTR